MKIKPSAKTTVIAILASIGAIVALQYVALLLAKAVSIPFVIPAVIGLIVFFVLRRKMSKREYSKSIVFEGVTRGEVETLVKAARASTAGMRYAINKLGRNDIRASVNDICDIADSILSMLKDDPRDLRIVKQFITYYLEPTTKIILKYAELATARPMPADAIATLERTERSLVDIRRTFLEQKAKMLANDAMDLDTEIKVFQSTSGLDQTYSIKKDSQKQDMTYPRRD